ncbi:MAG: helix-hairpin-helix domain-containing protein, partial [Halobacteria archaeon]|nr:helix-hairpin-helix domain-containing protein [Halobacteria archaeon]
MLGSGSGTRGNGKDVNDEISVLLEEFADLLEAKGVDYKPRAYRDAAESVRNATPDALDEPTSIENVGDAIGSKIEEYRETGGIDELDELRDEYPIDMRAITGVEGVGPKTAGKLYDELGITNLDELEEAAKSGEIQEVKGFGSKTEQNILEGIEFARRKQERELLGNALPLSREIEDRLEDHGTVERAVTAGSIRRRRETIGDIDVVVVSDDHLGTAEFVTGWDNVEEVIQEGESKTSVRIRIDGAEDIQLDLHLVDSNEFGSALQYFTGSKEHNVEMRDRAIDEGMKLNEYGLW